MQLFTESLALEGPERLSFLDRECGNDETLREEIETLFRADAAAGSFLERPMAPTNNRSGERLGAYRLIGLIGSGGMGSVYRAERADGAFAKPVAIKLLTYDAGDLRLRFAQEQRILGALSHPNIANLLDVGVDSNGAPYLVMEHVHGLSITAYVDDQALDLRARLRIFMKILDAVQTAHSQLIVHRDIKPSNILVDGHGEPKLLDFGIAKLLGEIATANTRTGLGPLTPEYASPEQVRGEPIGTGSDVYSLGVLLFELATGKRPYRINDTRPSSIERVVCETDPPRPSASLVSSTSGGSKRDLDAIVLKALAKSRKQRFASCVEFADDLQRWLDGEHVRARVPSWPERSGRFLRRHRFATAVALALLAGTALALWQGHVASIERDRAERINHFLTGMLAAGDPGDLGRKATLGDVLDRAQRQAEREFADDPTSASGTELTLAQTYMALGDLDAARRCATLALSAAEKVGDGSTTIDAQVTLGNILKQRGEYDAAAQLLNTARTQAIAQGSARQRGVVAAALGSLESARGNYPRAKIWFDSALIELPASADGERAQAMNDMAIVVSFLGDDAAALNLHQQTVATLRRLYPRGHPQLAEALRNLADMQQANGDNVRARASFKEALAMQIDLLGPNHQSVVSTISSITNMDLADKDIAAALDDGARAWAAAQTLSADNPIAGYAAIMYGEALLQGGRTKEAVAMIESALRIRKARLPADHPLVVNTESVLGLARAQAGDAGGEELARSAYERQRTILGEKHALTVIAKQRVEQIAELKHPMAMP